MSADRPRAAPGLLLALVLALAPSAARAALGERYVDPQTGFSIRPPQGWVILPKPAVGVNVAFRGPRTGDFAPSINVAVLPTPLTITPQALRRTVDELQAQFGGPSPPPLAKDLAGKVPAISNYRVTNARVVTLFGADAGFLESTYDQQAGAGRIRLRNFQVVLPGPGNHTVLTYTASADSYSRFEKEAHDSVNSFAAGAAPAGAAAPEKPWHAYGQLIGTLLGMVFLVGFMAYLMRRARRRRR